MVSYEEEIICFQQILEDLFLGYHSYVHSNHYAMTGSAGSE